MILIWIIMAVVCAVPVFAIARWHRDIIIKYWKILVLINIFVLFLWSFGDNFARQNNIWHISFDNFSGKVVLGMQIGNAFWFLVINTILSIITIIMWQAHHQHRRFRDLFFNRK